MKPELNYRLGWFNGENAGGTWTLDIRDDTAGPNGGTLLGWYLEICEQPPIPAGTIVFSTDFESGAAGFTHSGADDEWELGLPATAATTTSNPPPVAAFTTCNSGTNCWKTDLDNTYNFNSNQDLISPSIDLTNFAGPATLSWAMRYQMESAAFDNANVTVTEVGNPGNSRIVWQWADGTMTNAAGNPSLNIGASAGWANYNADISDFAGKVIQVTYHVDSDNTINLGGLAIDDVTVRAALSADLAITKTDGVTTATPGGSVTYTITASNAGPSSVTGATVADTFPASLTLVNWTCVGAGGGTCTAAGSGHISDTVNLPAGGSVTYTVSATISGSATGTLSNTATVTAPAGVTDPTPGNNSATDTDTLTPQADLAITKTDGVTSVNAGGSVTYTITASNPGPSNATGATVADTFPASLTLVNWTCVGAGGGTCTAAGSGHISDTVNLPAGGSVTYTVSATISGSATGTLSNTATVTAPAGVTDPNPGNNSATDTDTIISSNADLAITKVDTPDPVVSGNNITYTIGLTNNGPDAATNVVVADTVPTNTTFQSLTSPAGFTCTTPAVGGTGNVTCNAASLANGANVTFTLVVKVNPATPASTVISNTVSVASDSDPTAGNNSATATTTVTIGSAPTIIAQNSSRGRNTSANIVIATVNDPDQTEDTLVVTATPVSGTGVTITNISVSPTGVVTATVTVGPTATTSTFTLTVTDNSNRTATATLTITVFAGGGRPVSPGNP